MTKDSPSTSFVRFSEPSDIIRFSHGATSGRKSYRSSFIPGMHDVYMIFRKPLGDEGGAR